MGHTYGKMGRRRERLDKPYGTRTTQGRRDVRSTRVDEAGNRKKNRERRERADEETKRPGPPRTCNASGGQEVDAGNQEEDSKATVDRVNACSKLKTKEGTIASAQNLLREW